MTEGLDLHLGVDKGPGSSDGRWRRRCGRRSGRVGCTPTATGANPAGDRPAELIIRYAAPPPHAWSRALEALAEVVQEVWP